MFTSKYRYGIIILLGIYSYVNTLFSEVYTYYGIHAPWYSIMLVMVAITLVVWEANRLLLVALRRFYEQLSTWRFLILFFLTGMVASVVLTLGIAVAATAWLHPGNKEAAVGIKLAFTYGTRINLFLHIINGIFIFNRQYRHKLVEAEELKRIHAQAQLQAIKNQVNPHFLFNNLNVLSGMVIRDNPEANTFIEEFSKVYRHILSSQYKELVTLATELEYIRPYIFLLEKRFPESIMVSIEINHRHMEQMVVPAALQMLMENAIKHNVLSKAKPLKVLIAIDNEGRLYMQNNIQPKPPMEDSRQLGLNNIAQRYELITGATIDVMKNETTFTVSLPLIQPTP
ncbi:MAG TPA: histidine kinase [Chitinophagaceae bacterium]|nr:histidine kinase [Chitinophagaceae bacterium]